MTLLKEKDRQYLQDEFAKLTEPVRLILFTQEFECASCRDTHTLLEETAALSEKIELITYDLVQDKEKTIAYGVERVPAVIVEGERDYGIRFLGIPSGYEFSSLIEDIIDVGTGKTSLSDATKERLSQLEKPVHIQVFVTPSCPYCPKAVRTAHMMAMESEKVTADMVMANEFPDLANRYGVMAVPKVVLNGKTSFEGAIPEEDYISFVTRAAA
jgi:glutaredoxin-like protein